MPADGVQAAAWGGISARPAGSTDEITSVLAAQKEGENGRKWPSTSVRCAAAILPESEVDRTRRGHRENGARDPNRSFNWPVNCKRASKLFGK